MVIIRKIDDGNYGLKADSPERKGIFEVAERIKDRAQQYFSNPLKVKSDSDDVFVVMTGGEENKGKKWWKFNTTSDIVFSMEFRYTLQGQGKKIMYCSYSEETIWKIVNEEMKTYGDKFNIDYINTYRWR